MLRCLLVMAEPLPVPGGESADNKKKRQRMPSGWGCKACWNLSRGPNAGVPHTCERSRAFQAEQKAQAAKKKAKKQDKKPPSPAKGKSTSSGDDFEPDYSPNKSGAKQATSPRRLKN